VTSAPHPGLRATKSTSADMPWWAAAGHVSGKDGGKPALGPFFGRLVG